MDTETRQIHNFRDGDFFAERYRLLARAGSGGFADVWRAEDTLTGKVVALKLYTRLDDESISELAKEYIRMADISHPNLLTGDHFDKVGNIPYLVMRYCSGGSLAGRIGRLSNDELQHIVSDIASGLAYLHSEGIVHQDIKPENILYDSDHDRYLLSDFGISSKSRTRMSKSINMANMTLSMTEAYAPPEKFSGNPADRIPDSKGDIFSLGITLYELATGELPFEPPMVTGRELLMQRGQLQLDFSKITDPQLRKIVERCLCYSKEGRPTAAGLLTNMNGEKSEKPDQGKQKSEKSGEKASPSDDAKHETVKVKVDGNPPQPSTVSEAPKPRRKMLWGVLAIVAVALLAILLLHKYIYGSNTLFSGISTEEANIYGVRMDGNDIVFTVDDTEYRYCMLSVSGGTFTMGCTGEQGGDCEDLEIPAHSVTVSGFRIGQTEVTQALWKAVMGSEPAYDGEECWTDEYGRGGDYPAYYVSYNDCKEFVDRLNRLTGSIFRLPTEAEWEFAARGGNSSHGYKYSGSNSIGSVAWYRSNSGLKTHPVAQKQPNELGLYDMSGNVSEWCSDWYSSDYYSNSPSTNPQGPSSGDERVLRGGSWFFYAKPCRVSWRFNMLQEEALDYYGFRLAL